MVFKYLRYLGHFVHRRIALVTQNAEQAPVKNAQQNRGEHQKVQERVEHAQTRLALRNLSYLANQVQQKNRQHDRHVSVHLHCQFLPFIISLFAPPPTLMANSGSNSNMAGS